MAQEKSRNLPPKRIDMKTYWSEPLDWNQRWIYKLSDVDVPIIHTLHTILQDANPVVLCLLYFAWLVSVHCEDIMDEVSCSGLVCVMLMHVQSRFSLLLWIFIFTMSSVCTLYSHLKRIGFILNYEYEYTFMDINNH